MTTDDDSSIYLVESIEVKIILFRDIYGIFQVLEFFERHNYIPRAMNKLIPEEEYVIFDGRNIARNSDGNADWNQIFQFLDLFPDERIVKVVVMPCWIEIDLIKKIKNLATLQLVDVSKDKEWDDRVVLALCQFFDGFYVSNDLKMYKHSNSDKDQKKWFQSRRIGYILDDENKPTLIFPECWRKEIIEKEVRK